ncbi:MAG: hypothetical protein HXK78_02225 [Lachnospiraceae bacterium]|nr:hypothetical protein [Lachnospiraceae bacterium]
MSWAEVSKVNSDFMEIPLDKRLDLADYKLYGEKSHVFQNKDRLHALYETTGLTMNDLTINGEALEYITANNKHVGEALVSVFSIERKDVIKTMRTMQAVASSSTAMQAVASSSTAMQAVLASSTAIASICKSSYNTTKAVIKAINSNEDNIKKVFDIVTSDNTKFQFSATQYKDVVGELNQYCNTPNTIILCALGNYNGSGSVNLLINNEPIRTSINSAGKKPSSVARVNCNAIAVPNATFTEDGDGYAAIYVYQVI